MTRLTEEMVIARTRASDIGTIRKLNCWGSGLSDVSLLRRMGSVEVLSLSVNKIASLSDFQWCRNLQELYVRRNEIRDLNQVCYLRDLPRLRSLWLDENPCATCDLYRATVLRALPHLQKLDNVAVAPEEVQEALRRGAELLHPEEAQSRPSPASGSPSPPPPPPAQQQQQLRHRVERSPPRRAPPPPSDPESEPELTPNSSGGGGGGRRVAHPDDEIPYYDTDRRNANYEPDPATAGYGRHGGAQYNGSYDDDDVRSVRSGLAAEERSCAGFRHAAPPSQLDIGRAAPALNGPSGLFQHSAAYPASAQQHQQQTQSYSRRPVNRNSNILSAVLCLIKELDYPSLEVVEVAVRSRMEEF